MTDKLEYQAGMEYIDRDKALSILKKNSRNRKIRATVVDFYADQLEKGVWDESLRTPIIIDWDGELLDGQHRLSAIVQANVGMNCYVIRGVDPEAYKVVDTGAPRRPADIMLNVENARKVAAVAKYMVGVKYGSCPLSSAIVGFVRNRSKSGGVKSTNKQICEEVENNYDFYQRINALGMKIYTSLGGGPLSYYSVALGIIDYAFEPDDLEEFVNEFSNHEDGNITIMNICMYLVKNRKTLSRTDIVALILYAYDRYKKGVCDLKKINITNAKRYMDDVVEPKVFARRAYQTEVKA